jgi:hypothetical protein
MLNVVAPLRHPYSKLANSFVNTDPDALGRGEINDLVGKWHAKSTHNEALSPIK